MDSRTEEHVCRIHVAMVTELAKSGDNIMSTMNGAKMHLLHMAIGMSGEAGELLDALSNPFEPDRNHVIEELGDYEFYLEGFRQGIRTTFKTLPSPYDEVDKDQPGYILNILIVLNVQSANVLDCVKKYVIYNHKDLPMLRLGEHMFLIEHALREIRQYIDVSRGAVLAANVVKLSKGDSKTKPRYEGGKYTDKAAQVRADKS